MLRNRLQHIYFKHQGEAFKFPNALWAINMTLYTMQSVTHCVSCWNDADQNHKASQMGCIAANMSGIDNLSLHPSVGPPSCPIGPSAEVEEGTTKLLQTASWY